jgi:hypothetical protein
MPQPSKTFLTDLSGSTRPYWFSEERRPHAGQFHLVEAWTYQESTSGSSHPINTTSTIKGGLLTRPKYKGGHLD